MRLAVCPLSDVPSEVARLRPAGVVSLLAPGQAPPELPGGPTRLLLPFHDIVEAADGLVVPDEEMVAQLLAFPAAFAPDATVLIHCWMGISRSPAAAFALACALSPERGEAELAQALRAVSPSATPNRRLVALADQQLGRHGRMSAAIVAIGRGEDAFVGAPFTLEV